MKTIAILAESITEHTLAAVLPPRGIASVAISASAHRHADETQSVHAFRNPARFAPTVRVDLVVDDTAVDTVFDSISFAYGAGFFSDAEAWISEPAVLAA